MERCSTCSLDLGLGHKYTHGTLCISNTPSLFGFTVVRRMDAELQKSSILLKHKSSTKELSALCTFHSRTVSRHCPHEIPTVVTLWFLLGDRYQQRFALWYGTVVLSVLSQLSVCSVGVLWLNGWIDQDATSYGGGP